MGILSDTHKKIGRAEKIIDLFLDEACQYIIHAGDIVRKEVLEAIVATNLPYRAILGNNDLRLVEYMDHYNLYQEPYYFKIKSKKIKLMHHPFYLTPESCDIIIFGHTHEYHCQYHHQTLFLNPGESCARDTNISNAIILEIHKSHYKVHHYYRSIGEEIWGIQKQHIDI